MRAVVWHNLVSFSFSPPIGEVDKDKFRELPSIVQADVLKVAEEHAAAGYNNDRPVWEAACAIMAGAGLPPPPQPFP